MAFRQLLFHFQDRHSLFFALYNFLLCQQYISSIYIQSQSQLDTDLLSKQKEAYIEHFVKNLIHIYRHADYSNWRFLCIFAATHSHSHGDLPGNTQNEGSFSDPLAAPTKFRLPGFDG